jgi:hypothetical protein
MIDPTRGARMNSKATTTAQPFAVSIPHDYKDDHDNDDYNFDNDDYNFDNDDDVDFGKKDKGGGGGGDNSVLMITAELVNEPVYATQVTTVVEDYYGPEGYNSQPGTTVAATTSRMTPRSPLAISHVYYDEEGGNGGTTASSETGSIEVARSKKRHRTKVVLAVVLTLCLILGLVIAA